MNFRFKIARFSVVVFLFLALVSFGLFLKANYAGAEKQEKKVVINFEDNDILTTTELPEGTVTAPVVSCTPADVLKRYPDTPKSQAQVAACANLKMNVDALATKINIAGVTALLYGQYRDAQKATLAEISKLKKTDPFPSLSISPAGADSKMPVGSVIGISAECIPNGDNGQQVAYVGTYNPALELTDAFEQVPASFLSAYRQFRNDFNALLVETDEKKHKALEDKVFGFVNGDSASIMKNTPDGIDSMRKSGPTFKQILGSFTVTISATVDPSKRSKCLIPFTDWYNFNIDGYSTHKCYPFTGVKAVQVSSIKSKLDEYTKKKAKFTADAEKYKKQADDIKKANSDCFGETPTANDPTPSQLPQKIIKPASGESANGSPAITYNPPMTSTTLRWSSENARICTGTNFNETGAVAGTFPIPTSGSVQVSPKETTMFTITCDGVSSSTTVTVIKK